MCKICSIPECGVKVRNKGLCNKHYLRLLRHGDPTVQLRRSPGSVTEEDKKRWKRLDYEKNKDKYKERAEKWRTENVSHYRASKKEYLSREDVKIAARIRAKEWKEKNLERKRLADKNWRENNVDKKRSYQAFRRAKVKQATPPWLTKEHRQQIALVYKEALRLSEDSGVLHHVDHIVPLNGRRVSGLHVPWNLCAIPASENHKKSNKFDQS